MNDSVSRWLDRLSRQATRGTTYALAIPADVVSPVSLVAAYDGHLSLSFWQAPSRDGDAVFAGRRSDGEGRDAEGEAHGGEAEGRGAHELLPQQGPCRAAR